MIRIIQLPTMLDILYLWNVTKLMLITAPLQLINSLTSRKSLCLRALVSLITPQEFHLIRLFLGLWIILKTFLAFLYESYVTVFSLNSICSSHLAVHISAVPAKASATDFQISEACGKAHSVDITTYLLHFMSVQTNRVSTVLHLILIFCGCQTCILKYLAYILIPTYLGIIFEH